MEFRDILFIEEYEMTYNLIFIHNIMAKTTKFNFKKVNYHNFLEKKDKKYMILFLLGLIVLCALFYFFMKREGYGCKKEGMKTKHEEPEKYKKNIKENYQDKNTSVVREMLEEDEEDEEEEMFNCDQLKNKTMEQLSGYTFEQLKECVLE